MKYKWIISPLVVEKGIRKPLVSTLMDPGRANKAYRHTSIVNDQFKWILSLARGKDYRAIDRETKIIPLTLEIESPQELDKKIEDIGFVNTIFTRMKFDKTFIPLISTYRDLVNFVGKMLIDDFKVDDNLYI